MSEEDIPIEVEFIDCLADYYRCVRNACAHCHENQEQARNTLILMNTRDIVQKLNTENRDETIVCVLRSAIQFLGNSCVGNPFNQSTVWDMFLPDDFRWGSHKTERVYMVQIAEIHYTNCSNTPPPPLGIYHKACLVSALPKAVYSCSTVPFDCTSFWCPSLNNTSGQIKCFV